MTPNLAGQQFGDTTYTKVFVGGLAWETHKDTMKQYFEQFGEILEAVIISEKTTGRSKGYGFVTFSEPEAATRACADPSPVIDGRRTNCNIASLGIKRSWPTTPQHVGANSFKLMKSFQGDMQGGMTNAFPPLVAFPHYAIHHAVPYHVYSYSPYAPDYPYPTTYCYGDVATQYPIYEGTDITNGMVNGTNNSFYPYLQFVNGETSHGVQYPQLIRHSVISSTAGVTEFALEQYGISTPLSFAPSFTPQISGMAFALPLPSLPTPTAKHYKLVVPTPFSTATVAANNPWPNHG
ncbi:RNA-binding protein 38 [Dendrobium catenatum]|uniref:Glycine-rich RNA-binding protein 4, mitochondrial n=1 Tax=Dendrobium catenatum TaxID=906689 RepID=A0A2I0W592_9ASPA|nr:RNA-binding protein 38 [Dendrobium catenatum]PKU70823.1 Glycine-rich RNA-binding protein 4, mitochondrial [Dendrobium catenatum]